MLHPIIDLGTNTIRLCIYEKKKDGISSFLEKKEIVGITHFIANDELNQEGIDKICYILNGFSPILDTLKINRDRVHIFATASLRNVSNTKEILFQIKEKTGYMIDVLSGEEEAMLDFIGATKESFFDSGLVLDIGGGSTELVGFRNKEIKFTTSIPLGSLNLYTKFVRKIIPNEQERQSIKSYVKEQLYKTSLEKEIFAHIIGVGGTIRAASKLNAFRLAEKERKEKHEKNINIVVNTKNIISVTEVSQMLYDIKNSHRMTIKPIMQTIPDRVHTIIPGLIILETIANYFDCKDITPSKYGIREGYLFEKVVK